MYTEFVITMTAPAVGLLLIFLFYRGWLWRIQRTAAAAGDSPDAETGSLQKHGDSMKYTDTMASHGARDLCVWLAIGWLFMVHKAPNHITVIKCSCYPIASTTIRLICSVHLQVYTILCRTTFQSFACTDIVRPYRSPLPAFTSKNYLKNHRFSRTMGRHFTKTSAPAQNLANILACT
jgi:hypothetical protein